MNPIQKLLAGLGWRLTRIHPEPPIAWCITDGLNFNFRAVDQATPHGGLFQVATSTGRWHVLRITRTGQQPERWMAAVIQHYATPAEKRDNRCVTGSGAGEVIAELFKTHNPDVYADLRRAHLAKAAAHAARGRKTKKG